MPDILIKNMEMPKQMESPITITIFKNGSVWMNDVTFGKGKLPNAKAVALPEHGRLIDADAFKNNVADMRMEKPLRNGAKQVIEIGGLFGRIIDEAPTIVEATNGTDN